MNDCAQRSARAKQAGWRERTSERCEGTRERVNGRASDPLLQSGLLAVLAHSALFELERERRLFVSLSLHDPWYAFVSSTHMALGTPSTLKAFFFSLKKFPYQQDGSNAKSCHFAICIKAKNF